MLLNEKIVDTQMPESDDMLEEELKKSMLSELAGTRDKGLIPGIIQGAKGNGFKSLKTSSAKWPAALNDYARHRYHGACTAIVPPEEAVFEIDEESGDVPFKKKIFATDGKVIKLNFR